ncbi:MAG: glycosyltransferase family 4 protein [Planctomycetota bacterium]|nr:glycosyltransferase family 4 protein [Planctomycetota bacterium]MDA0932108.1 glycosyltransferase family 4 protein [Planctomycetota bacterium]MDA1220521.1 glycosyltransferase family 4 protein [Planctomycetota bacterium]
MTARITLVVHQFLPRYFTGTEQYAYSVAKGMQKLGHDVSVISLEPNFAEREVLFEAWEEAVDDLPVWRLRFWHCLDRDFERMEVAHPYVAAQISKRLAETRPDLVHFFHLRYLGAELIAEARALAIPTVVHLMDFWYLCPAIVLRRPDGTLCEGPPQGGLGCIPCMRPDLEQKIQDRELEDALARIAPLVPSQQYVGRGPTGRAMTLGLRPRRLHDALLGADRVLAPSRFLRDMFVKNGYPSDRIDVLTYGVDTSRLAGAERAPRPDGAPLRLAFFGSIAEYKGTDVLVRAVLASRSDVTLSVHGRLTDFPDFAPKLAEEAASDPRVRFEGPFPRERLGSVLAGVDVLVAPSKWYENTPFVILEAYAAGVPVIASDLGGMSEIVADGVHGDLFPAGDETELRHRIDRLAAEPDRLTRYRTALPPVKTLQENVEEIAGIYRELGAPT